MSNNPVLKTNSLLMSKDNMTLFAEWNPAPVISLNSEFMILTSNQAAKDAFCICHDTICSCSNESCSCSSGKNICEILPSLKENKKFRSWLNLASIDEYFNFESELKKKTYQFTFRKVENNVIHIYGSDITELKQMQRMKEDMEKIVTHDLKNPLSAIIGFSELLMDESLESEQKESVSMILESGRTMLSMINSSLDLVKMEEGIYQIDRIEFDLVDLLKNVEHSLQNSLSRKSMKIEYFLNQKPFVSGMKFNIVGEKRYIENLLNNIIMNAIESSPEKSVIRIEGLNTEDYTVKIHNEGSIPEGIRESFFEKYVTSGKKGGTGIGTYSAKLIAKAHGGDLTFRTGSEEGTTLILQLPK